MLNGEKKEPQCQAKLLGIILDQQLTFRDWIAKEPKKVNSVCIWNHNTTRFCEERNDRYGSQKSFFFACARPIFKYAIKLCNFGIQDKHKNRFRIIQSSCLKRALGAVKITSSEIRWMKAGVPL